MTVISPLAALIKPHILYRDSDGDYFYRDAEDTVILCNVWAVLKPLIAPATSSTIATLADVSLTIVATSPQPFTREEVEAAIAHEKATATVFPIMK
jgi:hypothetical protein